MEESKELQGLYTLFRVAIYVSLVLEFFMYALDSIRFGFFGRSHYRHSFSSSQNVSISVFAFQ